MLAFLGRKRGNQVQKRSSKTKHTGKSMKNAFTLASTSLLYISCLSNALAMPATQELECKTPTMNLNTAALAVADVQNDLGSIESLCGMCVNVSGPKGTVVAEIRSVCTDCKSGQLGLSPAALDTIYNNRDDAAPITWNIVNCSDVQTPAILQQVIGRDMNSEEIEGASNANSESIKMPVPVEAEKTVAAASITVEAIFTPTPTSTSNENGSSNTSETPASTTLATPTSEAIETPEHKPVETHFHYVVDSPENDNDSAGAEKYKVAEGEVKLNETIVVDNSTKTASNLEDKKHPESSDRFHHAFVPFPPPPFMPPPPMMNGPPNFMHGPAGEFPPPFFMPPPPNPENFPKVVIACSPVVFAPPPGFPNPPVHFEREDAFDDAKSNSHNTKTVPILTHFELETDEGDTIHAPTASAGVIPSISPEKTAYSTPIPTRVAVPDVAYAEKSESDKTQSEVDSDSEEVGRKAAPSPTNPMQCYPKFESASHPMEFILSDTQSKEIGDMQKDYMIARQRLDLEFARRFQNKVSTFASSSSDS